jgi:CheY-like chemotaxis protein
MNNPDSKPLSFVIIDDDSDDQEVFIAALSEVVPNATCEARTDAEKSLTELKTEELKPDIIFLDINMPKMGGFEFLAEANKHSILNRTKVVIYSTSSDLEDIQKAKTMGAHAFITKTNTFTELCQQLKNYLTRTHHLA